MAQGYATGGVSVAQTKTVTVIDASNAEDITLWYSALGTTITRVSAIVTGSTPSVTWTIRHDNDRSATGTELITGGKTTTETTSGQVTTVFNSATIPASSHVWLETTAVSGTVDSLSLTIEYT